MLWIIVGGLIGYLVDDSFGMLIGGFLGFASFVIFELNAITNKLSNMPQIESAIEKLQPSSECDLTCSFDFNSERSLGEIKAELHNIQQNIVCTLASNISNINKEIEWHIKSKLSDIDKKLSDMDKKLFDEHCYSSTKSITCKLSDIKHELSQIESNVSSIKRY